MAKLKLRYFPDPVLKQKSKKITTFDSSVRKLAEDMLDTMYNNDGVGLAAPQVGVCKQIMVIDVNAGEEEEPRKPIVFINPTIIEKEGEIVGQEGCLSFPGIYEYIERADEITVEACDETGKRFELSGCDYFSACVQHEIDHLDGIVFINRMSRLKATLVRKKMKKQLLLSQGD